MVERQDSDGSSGRTGSSRFRALVVDDSFLMRSAIKKILKNDHRINEIHEACDGQDALDKVKENDYDIILLDIEMPIMDGIEFMKRCKLHTDAMIVIVSSLARINSPQVEKAVYFGAKDVVAKPSNVTDISTVREKKNEILDIVSRSLSLIG